MAVVTVGNRRAKQLDSGEFRADVAPGSEVPTEFPVQATSSEGVVAKGLVNVTNGIESRIEISMPAKVVVRVVAGEAERIVVDGVEFVGADLDNGRVETEILVPTGPKEIKVQGFGPGGLTIEESIQCSAGRIAKVDFELDAPSLVLYVEAYPASSALISENTKVSFVITPSDGVRATDITGVAFNFGDQPNAPALSAQLPLKLTVQGGKLESTLVSHEYRREGRFDLSAVWRHRTWNNGQPIKAEVRFVNGDPASVLIVPEASTDDELVRAAQLDAFRKIEPIVRTVKDPERAGQAILSSRIALTSIDDPNFEYKLEDPTTELIEHFTRLFVQSDYHVLEKSSAVLARLAAESVVDIDPAFEKADRGGPGPEGMRPYRDTLHYGLVAKHESVERPIVYSLELAGTDASVRRNYKGSTDDNRSSERREVMETDGATPDDARMNVDVVSAAMNEKSAEKENQEADKNRRDVQLEQELPFLAARFNTANVVVAIASRNTSSVRNQPNAGFSAALRSPLTRRSAAVEVDFRVLARTGQILHSGTVRGKASELVHPSSMKQQP